MAADSSKSNGRIFNHVNLISWPQGMLLAARKECDSLMRKKSIIHNAEYSEKLDFAKLQGRKFEFDELQRVKNEIPNIKEEDILFKHKELIPPTGPSVAYAILDSQEFKDDSYYKNLPEADQERLKGGFCADHIISKIPNNVKPNSVKSFTVPNEAPEHPVSQRAAESLANRLAKDDANKAIFCELYVRFCKQYGITIDNSHGL